MAGVIDIYYWKLVYKLEKNAFSVPEMMEIEKRLNVWLSVVVLQVCFGDLQCSFMANNRSRYERPAVVSSRTYDGFNATVPCYEYFCMNWIVLLIRGLNPSCATVWCSPVVLPASARITSEPIPVSNGNTFYMTVDGCRLHASGEPALNDCTQLKLQYEQGTG